MVVCTDLMTWDKLNSWGPSFSMGSIMLDVTLYDPLDPTMSPTETVREKGDISYRPRDLTGVIHRDWSLNNSWDEFKHWEALGQQKDEFSLAAFLLPFSHAGSGWIDASDSSGAQYSSTSTLMELSFLSLPTFPDPSLGCFCIPVNSLSKRRSQLVFWRFSSALPLTAHSHQRLKTRMLYDCSCVNCQSQSPEF